MSRQAYNAVAVTGQWTGEVGARIGDSTTPPDAHTFKSMRLALSACLALSAGPASDRCSSCELLNLLQKPKVGQKVRRE